MHSISFSDRPKRKSKVKYFDLNAEETLNMKPLGLKLF